MQKGKKNWLGNVGYWVVLGALFAGNASADVRIVDATGNSNYYSASCPAGYVIVSTAPHGPVFSSSVNPTSASITLSSGLDSYSPAFPFKIFCAKVCQ
jgi:hypothetical protein